MFAGRGFEDFYLSRFEEVARAAAALVASREEAFDIAQESFVRCWERWPSFHDEEHAFSFTLRVAANLAKSHLRRLAGFRRLIPKLRAARETTPDPASYLEASDEVRRLLAPLSPQQKRVVVMCDGLDLSPDDAARVLGLAPSTVRVHLSRARERMRAREAAEAVEGGHDVDDR
jgi:RNA polymerase sigma factor (sigma-70 family)